MQFIRKTKYYIPLIILLVALIVTGIDIIRIFNYKTYPVRPQEEIATNESQIYFDLANGNKKIDWKKLDGTLEYISQEYDCSDFRLVNLIRILFDFEEVIPIDYKKKIENVLLNFRYWLDEPGENSMCYWSENHQILFASAEYLIGQKYPNVIFKNSGLTGNIHMQKAKTRILDWLMLRWNYGFTEFYSNVYYKEDIAALINLIDYAKDDEISKKSQIIMDLLFYDVATQSSNNMFISVSGRAYENNRKGGYGATLGGLTQYYWGDGKEIGQGMMYGLMVTDKYKLPQVIKDIAQDSSNVIIKQCNGIDISELKAEGFYGTDTRSMMMQWGMEAFVNPDVVRNSLFHIRKHHMFSNDFLKDFKILDFSLIRLLHVEPVIVKFINPQYVGTAIQKGNTYTFKTKDYSMYTVQNYHAGSYGDQHHIFGMNISNHFAIFHCHPAVERETKMQSPNYWVGYGHLPHSVQDKNINLSIYQIPDKKGIMEKELLAYTHAYFPKQNFDTTLLKNNYIFGKKGETYCALIGTNTFKFRKGKTDDLIQEGKIVYWITEAGSKNQDGSFDNFVHRIQNNKIQFDEKKLALTYYSNGSKYDLKYKADFKVNGKVMDINYIRFNSPYVVSDKKANTLKITMNGKSLYLDFNNMIRQYY